MSPSSVTPSSQGASSPGSALTPHTTSQPQTLSAIKAAWGIESQFSDHSLMSSAKADSNAGSDKPQRSRDGCLTCRTRKVKCNEQRPTCDKCRIKSRECVWPSGDESERRRNKKRRANESFHDQDGDNDGDGDEHRDVINLSHLKSHQHPPSHSQNHTDPQPFPRPRTRPEQRSKSKSASRSASLTLIPPSITSSLSNGHLILPLPTPSNTRNILPHRPPSILPLPQPSSGPTPVPTSPSALASTSVDPTRLNLPRLPDLQLQLHLQPRHMTHNHNNNINHSTNHSTSAISSSSRSRSTSSYRKIKGMVHVPPGFLPLLAQNGAQKGKEKEGNLVDWLVPEKMRVGLMMDPSFLEPYFPSVDERLVIRHYLSKSVHIIIAFESPHHPWNPWIAVHAPLAFKHLPGVNPAADALRAAMLAVGGVHLTYSSDPTDQAAAWRITKSATAKVLRLVRETLEEEDGKPKALEQENTELVLAALLSCTIASSLAADDAWHHLLSTVLALIDRLGGAQNILRDAPRDRLSPYRFFMEQLAIRDVFGCMTTEYTPSILRDAFTPWFFEAETWSRTDLEWESVERMFGISRGMVDMIARACNVIASVRSVGNPLPELHTSPEDPVLAPLHNAAQALMAELKIWDEAENFTPLHPRTQYGNHSYKHAIRIRMLRKVYNVSSDDERVVKSSQSIIELAGEMLALYGKITWLTWPILIAGFEIPPNDPSRRTALDMLGAFGPHACFDNRTAARMLSDYWMWHDMDGDHATSWEVARTLNQRPFLD